jgi:hypothetical protein
MNEKEKKEIENQIEKEREEHERDFFNLSKIKKCPKCRGEFDEGYVTMNPLTWSTSKVHFLARFMKSRRAFSQFPALRCKKMPFRNL